MATTTTVSDNASTSSLMTANNATSEYKNQTNNIFDATPLKIASLTFTFAASLFLVYVIAAMCYYGYRKKLMIGCGGESTSKNNRDTSIVNSTILLGAVFVFIYVSVEMPLVVPPLTGFCPIYHRIKISTFALSMSSIYFALWYRVFTTFYSNPILKKNLGLWMRFVNMLTIVFLALMVGSNLVLFFSAPAYATASMGCTPVQSSENNKVKWIVLVACTIFFQVTLLFSFIHPLCMHRRRMLHRGVDSNTTIPIIKRAAVVASICVVSDLINSGFAVVYKNPTVYLNHIVYSSNLLTNLTCVMFSFANWREKLLPFLKPSKTVTRTSESGKQTSSTGVQQQYTNNSV